MSADVIDPAGRLGRRWPDLILERPSGDLVVLELERTLKDPSRLARIVEGYTAALWFAEVRLLCTDPQVARGVATAARRAASARAHGEPAIIVAPWPGLPSEAKRSVKQAIGRGR